MSPRRRLFAIVLLVGAFAGTIALVVTSLAGSARPRAPAVPQDRPGPVLLVPGYGGSVSALGDLAARLRALGRAATVVPLPAGATGDLHGQAAALRDAARRVLATNGAASVDVVGYSAGGVVVRLWVRDFGGAEVVRRVVTLGSPHHGTDVAALAGSLVPGACPLACQQLVPGSALLSRLNSGDETPDGPRWVSLWTSTDRLVIPPDSARLAGALDVVVQSVCADETVDHGQLPRDSLVAGLVISALGVAAPVTPTPADCARLRALGSGS